MKSSSRITIRAATREDISSIASWQVAMAKETESMELDPSVVTRGVTHVFEKPHIGFYLIAEDAQNSVGCALVLSEWSDWRAGNVLWIHSVYIEPAHREVGAFSSIYHHLKTTVLGDPSLRGLRLYVDKSNAGAMAVYNKLGMNREHYHLFEWMKS